MKKKNKPNHQPQKQPTSSPGQNVEPNIAHGEAIKDTLLVLAALSGATIGLATYYQMQSLILWSSCFATIFSFGAIAAKWQKKMVSYCCLVAIVASLIVATACQWIISKKQPRMITTAILPEHSPVLNIPTPAINASPVPPEHIHIASSKKSPTPRGTATPEPEPTIHPDVLTLGVVAGYVYDAETNQSIQGAVIVAQNYKTNKEYRTASSSRGDFSMTVLAGSYSITVSREGYLDVTQHCTTSYGLQCGPIVNLQKKPK